VLDINLTNTFPCCKAANAPMRQRKCWTHRQFGIAGKKGNNGMTGCSAAKAGAIALTKSLGMELVATEFRVNAIAAAVFATDLIMQMTDDAYRTVLANIRFGRANDPKKVAAIVV
jgi:2-dehydro-3-deoxy-L-rhamnonate dehydrogenase (NAD+)